VLNRGSSKSTIKMSPPWEYARFAMILFHIFKFSDRVHIDTYYVQLLPTRGRIYPCSLLGPTKCSTSDSVQLLTQTSRDCSFCSWFLGTLYLLCEKTKCPTGEAMRFEVLDWQPQQTMRNVTEATLDTASR
jgi:hypothetical protein